MIKMYKIIKDLIDSYDFCLIFWKLNTNKILLRHNACRPFWCSEDIKKIGLEWHIWRLWHQTKVIWVNQIFYYYYYNTILRRLHQMILMKKQVYISLCAGHLSVNL
jgi:hypothetical protein